MGEVFLAVDDSLNRRAAIKILGTKHVDNETLRERFLREARALARLSHPHLITVYESGFVGEDGRPYFAMELLEGGDTEKLVEERGPLPSGVVALIGAQAAGGLGEAARAGITHRDVKPSNLGISAQGVLKVTDFSLAKSYLADKNLTGKGLVVGTADYIAPEQARGEELDERADLYSLGCTLFHLLTGKPPYRAEAGTEVRRYIDVMKAHLTAPVPDPRDFAPGVNDDLATLVRLCMDKDREKRPTFDELAPQLARLAGKLGGDLPRLTRAPFTIPTIPTNPTLSDEGGPVPTSDPDASSTGNSTQAMIDRMQPKWRRPAIVVPLVVAAATVIGAAIVLRGR